MDIERMVNRLAAEYKTRDPFNICADLGIEVYRRPMEGMRGFIQFVHGVTIIQISETLSEIAAVYVCAHELAHHFLHSGMNRVLMDCHTFMVPSKYENRADRFAAHLLWGEPPLFDEQCLTDWQIADCLNVAVCNVNARLLELGICY